MSGTITERHEGIVTSTEDDENRGRIRCTCPGLTGDETTELPFFIEPVHDWGWFSIPDVDETIEIEIVASSPQDEIAGQTTLEGMNPRWRGKRFINEGAPIHPDFLAENYGKRRGFATPAGQILIFDDKAGTVRLSWMSSPDAKEDARSQLILEKDKATVVVNEKHSVVLEPNKTSITHDGGNAATYENKDGDATLTVGDGAVEVAIGPHLEVLWGQTKAQSDIHDTHVHPSAMGPTGPPAPPFVFPAFDVNIKSLKVKIPDN